MGRALRLCVASLVCAGITVTFTTATAHGAFPVPNSVSPGTQAAGMAAALAPAQTDSGTLSASTYSDRLRMWANRARMSRGIPALKRDACLQARADNWTSYLASKDSFYHQQMEPILSACDLTGVGEILAKGPVTPHRMVRLWLHSPDHRRILLGRSFRLGGVAAHRDPNGAWIGAMDVGWR